MRACARILAAGFRPSDARDAAPFKKIEGAEKARCPLHPQPRTQKRRTSARTCRYRRNTRLSLRNGFNAYFALSPVIGLFLPPSPAQDVTDLCKLNTSCEVPGPHDFIVREPWP